MCIRDRYLDIGAFHPRWASNTHLLHQNGFSGYCVDLDDEKLKWFRFARGDRVKTICGAVSNLNDDFIEVLDMLEEERRVWVDWEENIYGKRGYSRMIYYTNIGTIAPDNSYLVFNAEGSVLGQLSGSFVSNLRGGDVILLGGSTYRVTNIQGLSLIHI